MSCQLNNVKEENINNSKSKQISSLGNLFLLKKCCSKDIKKTQFNNPDNDEDSDLFLPLPPHPTQSKSGKIDKKTKNLINGKKKAKDRNKNDKKKIIEKEYCLVPCFFGVANSSGLDAQYLNIIDHGKKHIKLPVFLYMI